MAKRRAEGELALKTRGKENLDRLGASLNKVVGSAPGVVGLSTAFVGVTAAIGATYLATNKLRSEIGSIIRVGRDVERSRLTWKSLLGTVEATDARIKELQGFAFSAPFELKNIEAAAVQMESLGKYSVEGLKAAGDAAAIFGRDITEATQALLGAARGELDMLKSFGIAKFELAEKMGKDVKDVGFQTKEDLAAVYEAAIAVMQDKFGGGMDELVKSTDGKLSMLSDSIYKARLKMSEGGLLEGLGRGLDTVIERMEDLHRSGFFEEVGEALGSFLGDAIDAAVELSSGLALSTPGGLAANVQASQMAESIQGRFGLAPRERGAGFLGLGRAIQLGASRNEALPNGLSKVNPELQPYVQRAAMFLLAGGDEETAREIVELGAAAVVARAQAQDPAQMKRFYDRQITDLIELRTPVKDAYGPKVPRGFGEGGSGGLVRPTLEGSEIPPELIELDPNKNPLFSVPEKLEEAWRPRVRNIVEELRNGTIEMSDAFDAMSDKAGIAYSAVAKSGGYVMKGLTQYTLQALDSQAKGHIKLKDIAVAASYGLVAGTLDAFSELWAKRGKAYMLEAGAFAIEGYWSGAASLAKIGAGYLALAGVTAGASLALQNRADRALTDTDFGSAPDLPDFSGDGGRDGGGGRTRSPGGRLVSAGAAPQSIVYQISVNYSAPIVYGEGGLREWFQTALVPLIQEARQGGQL